MLTFVCDVFKAGSVEFRFYLLGYSGRCISRQLRRVLAGTNLHRAWLSGHMGLYEQDGRKHGVCHREGYQFRKGKQRREESGIFEIIPILLRPFSY